MAFVSSSNNNNTNRAVHTAKVVNTAPRAQDNRNRESTRRNVPVKTTKYLALVSCDGLGGYDWSDQVEDGPNYALMAYSTSSLIMSKPAVETLNAKTSEDVPKGNQQIDLQEKGVIDSGCLRHMTGNMYYLIDYEEINKRYVSFGGNPKEGKITSKGTIRTGKLDFENMYFVKELKFNLFNVSQMSDKKNIVLFTDIEYVVLSPDFKLPDENYVLLRVPRKNNMYSVDLKNIIPKGGLTCLFAKATSDESRL
uniref:Ribonuclease H-like domain-containing protein n=1 Tax=Tanacetum cinerariifolium TaxID=118510 RepID=A0A6L2LT45_TANCI|nr:ribonuclease H-like domain-containing protein [Tanacetum cinerariifolium]